MAWFRLKVVSFFDMCVEFTSALKGKLTVLVNASKTQGPRFEILNLSNKIVVANLLRPVSLVLSGVE
jgi:hypothetical protein